MHYSALSLVKQALTGNRGWTRAWRNPEPRKQYDVIIIGGGGHGLATAYYLAKLHGVTNVAVLEKGYIGGGNTGRNTTIVRSNYMLNANSQFYEHSMKLWEGLSQDLNYNVMFSQRGVLNLFHTDAQRDAAARRGNAMRTPASRYWVGWRNPAVGPRATTRWPGGTRAAPIASGSISSRNARLPRSNAMAIKCSESKLRAASSAPARWASRSPATRAACSTWSA
jgi:glycine/D-amino acid oxidase-like deaminating enzyme